MTKPLAVDIRHGRFTIESQPFIPFLQESSLEELRPAVNTLLIRLPAGVDLDLNWHDQRLEAKNAIDRGLYIFWHLDFGLTLSSKNLKDPSLFLSLAIAVEEFVKLLTEFQGATLGVSLYKGAIDLSDNVFFNDEEREDFSEWLQELPSELLQVSSMPVLFKLTRMIEYLRRLASFIPETVTLFCFFDLSSISSSALAAHLLSKERFEVFEIGVKGTSLPLGSLAWNRLEQSFPDLEGWVGREALTTSGFPIKTAVCLPQDPQLNPQVLADLDALLNKLAAQKVDFRIIPEVLLTEQWDELETLIVIQSAVSPQGKRKLEGFCAAGGVVATSLSDVLLPDFFMPPNPSFH